MTTETTQDAVETVLVSNDNASGKGANPFRAPKPAAVKAEEPEEEYDEAEDEELDEEELKAKKAVAKKKPEAKSDDKPSSLDDIVDPELLRKMVRDTRREAARARTEKNKELAEFEEWKEAQKTEQQRVLDKAERRAAEAEVRLHKMLAANIVLEYNISEDLAEFVTGDTEDEMRDKAEKLRDTAEKPRKRRKAAAAEGDEDDEEKPAPKKGPGLLAGRRGTPVNKAATTDEWFNDLVKRNG